MRGSLFLAQFGSSLSKLPNLTPKRKNIYIILRWGPHVQWRVMTWQRMFPWIRQRCTTEYNRKTELSGLISRELRMMRCLPEHACHGAPAGYVVRTVGNTKKEKKVRFASTAQSPSVSVNVNISQYNFLSQRPWVSGKQNPVFPSFFLSFLFFLFRYRNSVYLLSFAFPIFVDTCNTPLVDSLISR